MFWRKRKRQRRSRRKPNTVHYRTHKELARSIITARTEYWNQFYTFSYNRISIKNQLSCWGSCSELGNLNFNYKIIFLPESLMDYIIVHELCHLSELNHSREFWAHVERMVPDYKNRRTHLKKMTRVPERGFPSSVFYTQYVN